MNGWLYGYPLLLDHFAKVEQGIAHTAEGCVDAAIEHSGYFPELQISEMPRMMISAALPEAGPPVS